MNALSEQSTEWWKTSGQERIQEGEGEEQLRGNQEEDRFIWPTREKALQGESSKDKGKWNFRNLSYRSLTIPDLTFTLLAVLEQTGISLACANL